VRECPRSGCRHFADKTPPHGSIRLGIREHRTLSKPCTVQHNRTRQATARHPFGGFPKPGVAGSIPAGGARFLPAQGQSELRSVPLWAAARGRFRRHPPTRLQPHSTKSRISQTSPSGPCHQSRPEHMLASRENGLLAKDVVCGEAITTCPSMAQDGGHPPHFDGCGPQKVVKGRHGDAMGCVLAHIFK
jgi:hypothetical protein